MLEQQFKEKLLGRSKRQMIQKFLHQQKKENYMNVPIFTQFSGKKQIIPFRNTQCLQSACVYDIEELIEKYRNSGYLNYLNFICHTCRKLIDIQYFFKDEDLEKMINKIWKKYNNPEKIICSQVSIFKDGQWEPVLPEYIKILERNIQEKNKEQKKDQQDSSQNLILPENDVSNELQELSYYVNFPMLDEFDASEYQQLMKEFSTEEDPLYESDIILNRFKAQVKWGEFLQLKNSTSFSTSIMTLYVNYLDEFYVRKKKQIGIINKKQTAFFALKVTGYDEYKQIAKFFYFCDNFQRFAQPLIDNCDIAIIVIYYDERWICYIASLEEKKFKQMDFLDDGISRTSQDELYNIGAYLIEQIFVSIKLPRVSSRQMEQQIMAKQIISQQVSEISKKIQYYSDCGLQIAFYIYSYLRQELDQMKRQKQWQDQNFVISTRLAPIIFQKEEQKSFISRLCWIIIKLSQEKPQKVLFYTEKPVKEVIKDSSFAKKDPSVGDDSIDKMLRKDPIEAKLSKVWDFSKIDQQNQTNKGLLVSETIGKIITDMKVDKKQNAPQIKSVQEKESKRMERYWQLPIAPINVNSEPVVVTSVKSPQFPLEQLQQQKQQQQQMNYSQKFQHSSQASFQQNSQQKIIPQNILNNENNSKPFLVIPKKELVHYLNYYKDKISEEYRKQAIYRQFFQMSQQAEYQQLQQQQYEEEQRLQYEEQQRQQQGQKQQSPVDISMSKSEFEKFYKKFDPDVSFGKRYDQKDKQELLELQRDLGLNEDELANLDVYEYNQLLDVMDALGKERKQNEKLKKKGQQKKNNNNDDDEISEIHSDDDDENDKNQDNSQEEEKSLSRSLTNEKVTSVKNSKQNSKVNQTNLTRKSSQKQLPLEQ